MLMKILRSDSIRTNPKTAFLIGALYALGALSGFMFLAFLFTGSYTLIDFKLGVAVSSLVNVFLSVIFFLQHSVMVRKGVKERLKTLIPESHYKAFYALSSIVVLLAVLIFWQKSPVVMAQAGGMVFWLLRALFVCCLIGFFWAAKSLDSFDALGIYPLTGRKNGQPRQITARGPYRWSRHPIYFLLIIIIWACPVLTLDRLIFNLLWTIWMMIGTFLEDRDLHREFGSPYREYSRRVPMLIPYKFPE